MKIEEGEKGKKQYHNLSNKCNIIGLRYLKKPVK